MADIYSMHPPSSDPNQSNNSCFFSLPAEQFTALSVLVGFLLAGDLTLDEQNSLGNFLLTVGQIMVTISTQASNLQSQNTSDNMATQLELIKAQISLLEHQLKY